MIMYSSPASNTRQQETSAPKSFGPAWSPVLYCATLDLVPAPARKKSIFGLPERENGGRQSTEKDGKCAGRDDETSHIFIFTYYIYIYIYMDIYIYIYIRLD